MQYKKLAAGDLLLKLEAYGPALSRNGVAAGNIRGQRGNQVAFAQRRLLNSVTGKPHLEIS